MADPEIEVREALEENVTQEVTQPDVSSSLSAVDLRTVLFNVFPYLNKKDILNCRVACHKWNFVIHDIQENHSVWENLGALNAQGNWQELPGHLPAQQHRNACHQLAVWDDGPAWTPETNKLEPIRLFGVQAFNDFCAKIANDHASTRLYCLRPVHLNPDTQDPNTWQMYWSNVGRKIQTFSKYVCHIRMDINWFSAESRAVGSLWALFILARMPQVKSIYLKHFQSPYQGKDSKKALNYVESEPLPRLVNLTSLTLEIDGRGHRKLGLEMDSVMVRLLTEYAPFLRRLVILQKCCDADIMAVLEGCVFNRLLEFKVKVANGDSLNGLLEKLKAPLVSNLFIEIDRLPAGEHLISTFSRLHDTMTNLQYINLKVNDILKNEHTLWFCIFNHNQKRDMTTLSSVKKLEVYHHAHLNYHAIFRCLPNLEFLHILGNLDDGTKKEEDGFMGPFKPRGEMWFADWLVSGRLNEYVPLWTKILPNLKGVTYKVRNGPCKKYSRDKYVIMTKKMELVEMYLKMMQERCKKMNGSPVAPF